MRKLLFFFAGILLLTACNGSNSDEATPKPPIRTPIFYLAQNALPAQTVVWVLDSQEYQEREAGLIASGQYHHQTSGAIAHLTLTVYRNETEAKQAFEALQAALPAEQFKSIGAMGQAAFILNTNQRGIALAGYEGVLVIEVEGTCTDLELLDLMQIGVELLEDRDYTPPVGTLGEATLPPVTEEP